MLKSIDKGRIKGVFILIIGTLVSLIVIQVYWVMGSYKLTEEEFSGKVDKVLKKVVYDVNDRIACFELFSKVYIAPGEGFYMVKQEWKSRLPGDTYTNQPDTITMYFANPGSTFEGEKLAHNFNDLKFSTPITAEVLVKFRFEAKEDSSEFYFERNQLEKRLTEKNFKNIISGNRPVEKVYDISVIDSLLSKFLRQENIFYPCYFGISRSDIDSIAYLSGGADKEEILKTVYKTPLNQDKYFSKPYQLAIYFPSKNTFFINAIWPIMLLSILVIVILGISFWYFVRIIFQQKKISEMKNDFIDNMTHEFNTPIANIALSVETIVESDGWLNPKTKKIIEIIGVENERLKENVERVLKVAAIEKEKFQLFPETINIETLINKVISNFEFRLTACRAQLDFENRATEQTIVADETHLINVLHNLIDNALKYGGREPIVKIDLINNERGYILSVKDNGIGITKEEQLKIFDKFYRVQSGNIHNVKGFGLGLSYVKSIVAAHKGTISVKSQLGNGTCFEVFLPLDVTKVN